MRITVLRTFSNSCDPIYEPLRGLGHEVRAIVYDVANIRGPERELISNNLTACGNEVVDDFGSLPGRVNGHNPDCVVMIGCCDAGGALMPDVGVLRAIGEHRPLILICCDGSETDWWPQLERYHDSGAFALQVNIDGVKVGPIGEWGLTTLCPVSDEFFVDVPWDQKDISLGFCGSFQMEDPVGGIAHPRGPRIRELVQAGLLDVRTRDGAASPKGYREYLSRCRCVWNHAATGSGDRMHVKARVLEVALAGAVLFESAGAPTSKWFDPGFDYFEYESALQLRDKLQWIDGHQEEAQEVAMSLQRKVREQHSPAAFWKKVFQRVDEPWRIRHGFVAA
jgi:hypothetical protein